MLLEWPAEAVAGYLSVIPGQLSALRWDAIAGSCILGRDAERRDPLNVYFKGLGLLAPHESMLYLAEDRVLCREIVSNPQTEWTISHIDNALAITDPCHSWEELLRQRKRWCNGYIACRVDYIKKLPNFIRDPSVEMRRKLRAVAAGTYHSIVLANDWCTPAIVVLVLFSLVQQAVLSVARIPAMQYALEVLSHTAFLALVVQFFICYRGGLSARDIAFLRLSVGLQASVLVVSLIVNILFGDATLILLLMLFIGAAAPLASLFGHRRLTKPLLTGISIVFPTNSIIALLMWMYAVCNAHDNSWGTKGLLTDTRNVGQQNPSALLQKTIFRRFRKLYVSIWLGSNFSLGYLIDKWCDSHHYDIATVLLSIVSAITLFWLVCSTCVRLGRAPHSAAGSTRHVYEGSVKQPIDRSPHQEPS